MKISYKIGLLLLSILIPFSFLTAQIQLGPDIEGEANGDWFGSSVSLSDDGTRVAIGAPINQDAGEDAGHVRIYEMVGESWTQLGTDIDGEAAFDECGWSVSLSADGNRVAIGAQYNDGTAFDAGHVRVYEWSGGNWTQLGEDIDGEAFVDWSGESLSLSADGNRVAIGAVNNQGNGFYAGHVRVYEWAGGNWTQIGTDIDGESADDYSGWSVSLADNGNRVAVGAIGNDGNGTDAGHARILEWNGGSWTQVGADIDGEAAGDWFGHSASLSADGSRVVISSMRNDGYAEDAGHVRIFDWDGASWMQLGADIEGKSMDDGVGRSVSLSGDGNRIAFGTLTGKVRIYDFIGGNWTQLGTDMTGEAPGDGFGVSVALTTDGERLAVGAPWNNEIGHVRVFGDIVTSVKTTKEEGIEIYPNPTTGSVYIIGIENTDISIRDGLGRLMKVEQLTGQMIHLEELPDGIYFISFYLENQIITKRIFKN